MNSLKLDRHTLTHLYSQLDTETLVRIRSTIKSVLWDRSKTERIPIKSTDISIRAMNLCDLMDVVYVDELASLGRRNILKVKNMGVRSLEEFDILLKQYNLKWSDNEPF